MFSFRLSLFSPFLRAVMPAAFAALAAVCAAAAMPQPAAAQEAQAAQQCAPQANKLAALQAAQAGVFGALRLAETPLYLGDLPFQTETGKTARLADFRGKTLLVNLWGVWCPPCRSEMPGLAELQREHGSADFAVLTIHDERSGAEKTRAFMRESDAENLPLYQDGAMEAYLALTRQGLARGLPVSLLVDKQGCLVASLNGGVIRRDEPREQSYLRLHGWGAPEAWAFIAAAMQAD